MANILKFKNKNPERKENDFLMILHWNYDEDFIEKNIKSFSKILKSTLEIFLGPINLEEMKITRIKENETFKNSLLKLAVSGSPNRE